MSSRTHRRPRGPLTSNASSPPRGPRRVAVTRVVDETWRIRPRPSRWIRGMINIIRRLSARECGTLAAGSDREVVERENEFAGYPQLYVAARRRAETVTGWHAASRQMTAGGQDPRRCRDVKNSRSTSLLRVRLRPACDPCLDAMARAIERYQLSSNRRTMCRHHARVVHHSRRSC